MEYIDERIRAMLELGKIDTDQKKLISSLSFYLDYNCSDYVYNYTFLPKNYEDFQQSVSKLEEKNNIYTDAENKINAVMFPEDKHKESKNDFLVEKTYTGKKRKKKIILDSSFCITVNMAGTSSEYLAYEKELIEKEKNGTSIISVKMIDVISRDNERICLLKDYNIESKDAFLLELEKDLRKHLQYMS